MCSLVSALAARELSVIFFFSAYLLLKSSADNLFKQIGHKIFLRECAFMKSRKSSLLERKVFYFLRAH